MPPLPAIPASAGALIYDGAGRLLILKPTYKTGWTIPGGVMEADGETPWDACRREVREECGLEVRGGRLACVDFRPSRPERAGGIRFLFDCGTVGDAELALVTVQPEEVAEFRLVKLDEALELLRPPIRRRVRAATRHRRCVYLENGRPVDGVSLAPGWLSRGRLRARLIGVDQVIANFSSLDDALAFLDQGTQPGHGVKVQPWPHLLPEARITPLTPFTR